MPEPRVGPAHLGNLRQSWQATAGIDGIVYHICGGRFDVATYRNNKSNLTELEIAADPARACVGETCRGCGRTAWRHELASLDLLQFRYPGVTTGKAIRAWQKAQRNAPPPELPDDPRKLEQRRLF